MRALDHVRVEGANRPVVGFIYFIVSFVQMNSFTHITQCALFNDSNSLALLLLCLFPDTNTLKIRYEFSVLNPKTNVKLVLWGQTILENYSTLEDRPLNINVLSFSVHITYVLP